MKTAPIKIINFNLDYLNDLVELVHSTIKECYPKVYPIGVVDFFLEYHSLTEVQKRIKDNKTNLILALIDNQLVGCGYLRKQEVGGVYISTNFQRRGIGEHLVKRLIELAREKKHDHIWLDATLLAKEFYLNMEFQLIEERTDFVGDNVPLHYYRMFMKL